MLNLKEEENNPGSSSGRTDDSGSSNSGSNPFPGDISIKAGLCSAFCINVLICF